jgi:hypothetical protein
MSLTYPIMTMIGSKFPCQLYTVTLDNTGNNNTTCRTIEDIHKRRGLPKWNSSEQQLPYVLPLSFTLCLCTILP